MNNFIELSIEKNAENYLYKVESTMKQMRGLFKKLHLISSYAGNDKLHLKAIRGALIGLGGQHSPHL